MIPRRTLVLLLASLIGAAPLRAQSPFWAGLRPGPFAVGFRSVDTVDATRSFPGPAGISLPRPMRLYVWYPSSGAAAKPVMLRDLIPEAWSNGGVFVPTDTLAFGRTVVRGRSGATPATMTDAQADDLLALPLYARWNAAPVANRFPVVLLAPGQPLTMPVAAEYLASLGMVVIGISRKDGQSFESLSFTPNPASLDAESADLAFALGFARGRSNADASRVGMLGYSSSGLSLLGFAFRNATPRAVAVFEGWEGWHIGQSVVRELPGYDPIAFRAAYLSIQKASEEPIPAMQKTSAFLDSVVYSRRTRASFDEAIHTDFATFGVAREHSPATQRRNFVAAHELLASFMSGELASSGRVAAPSESTWLKVETRGARPAIPTVAEFFHLAEVDPIAADALAGRLATMGIVPFSEGSLSRLAQIAKARDPRASATLYGIVARGFPASFRAQAVLSDALFDIGRIEEAQAAARSAIHLGQGASNVSDPVSLDLMRRMRERAGFP
ncbi:MAG: hypothetical protein ABIY52_01545 [Gemmatimonadaceae bacterium]